MKKQEMGKVKSKWISVKARLPNPGERVIATNGYFVGEAYTYIGAQFQRQVMPHSSIPWKWMFEHDVTHCTVRANGIL